MSEQICTNQETELSTIEEELSTKEKLDTNEDNIEKKSKRAILREKVFDACELLYSQGINPTRDKVRPITKGSDRDISDFMKEWRASKNVQNDDDTTQNTNTTDENNTAGQLVVQTSNDIIQNKNENNIQTSSEVLETTPINSYNDPDNVAEIAISALNRAKGMILTEEKIVQHFFKNPDQMPEKIKQEIAKAKSETNAMINERSATFEVDFFMKKALMSLEK